MQMIRQAKPSVRGIHPERMGIRVLSGQMDSDANQPTGSRKDEHINPSMNQPNSYTRGPFRVD